MDLRDTPDEAAFRAELRAWLEENLPEKLRGRVMSLYMLDRGLMPAGALFAGVVAHFIGAPSTVAAMGAIAVAVATVNSTSLRNGGKAPSKDATRSGPVFGSPAFVKTCLARNNTGS